eukprot:c11104_g1_i2.p1 GENE.c11104_g1_i2~~c11104_g1_i2.p1  ORF type:complete len:633 (-),score=160.90 c11104_g1_i2:101-1759(-)
MGSVMSVIGKPSINQFSIQNFGPMLQPLSNMVHHHSTTNDFIANLHTQQHHQLQNQQELQQVQLHRHRPHHSQKSSEPAIKKLSIHLDSSMETLWYAERPFPPFNIHVVEAESFQAFQEADGWEMSIRLIDGYGRYMDDKLYNNSGGIARGVVVHKGTARVAGLRFHAVSSKNGGHFKLQFEIGAPYITESIVCQTPNITILSTRLYHNPKSSLEKLLPSDGLSRMPGIGKLYAERFEQAGIHSIGALAQLDFGAMTCNEQSQFMEKLRKDKGTMTKQKLDDYILQAKDVMQRSGHSFPISDRTAITTTYATKSSPTPSSEVDLGNGWNTASNICEFSSPASSTSPSCASSPSPPSSTIETPLIISASPVPSTIAIPITTTTNNNNNNDSISSSSSSGNTNNNNSSNNSLPIDQLSPPPVLQASPSNTTSTHSPPPSPPSWRVPQCPASHKRTAPSSTSTSTSTPVETSSIPATPNESSLALPPCKRLRPNDDSPNTINNGDAVLSTLAAFRAKRNSLLLGQEPDLAIMNAAAKMLQQMRQDSSSRDRSKSF